ncbi:MAG: hypothetical protein K0R61_34 [Microvirga sp.]|jgi:hypothetical protein|nr:hypothetical protein [Microvirga sp.]MDF2969584.1 hypothetical protein [Microvirga sp.]
MTDSEVQDAINSDGQPMTLVERLRNPSWESVPGEDARLNIAQTRETMDEAADLISAITALLKFAGQ